MDHTDMYQPPAIEARQAVQAELAEILETIFGPGGGHGGTVGS